MENRLVLGIDNSLDELVIALSIEEKIIEERHIKAKRNASEIMASMVTEMLRFHDYSPENLNIIVVTLGPGTFTGIRVALAFCKGLASGMSNVAVVGVSTLDVLGAFFSSFEGYYIFPVIDAKKGEVFFSLYYVKDNELFRETDIASKKPQDAVQHIKTPCICFGSGLAMCEPHIPRNKDIILVKDSYKKISGEMLIKTGLRLLTKNKKDPLIPVYGRKSEAEIKLNVF
ncbi:MAG TPA: tRNA (adenosine(37)-N6)-threonylcarbamoyltransferase complex dimerization subunit type 1 TsaB [Syntrophorhabdaceae bacterium]|mgnify:CR=1 FL=1|nr:tRNA (adenosine(37)-N6)-threonylcarbamoyltransferase complex dimerization subunit type 1 TsaB [Syntrophorhabdaceae bacterium]HPU30871.1 tRNA (adenosine(37)-N6)-threonylcarbamoyltransferase complex dimerization subunit type 1 TsaB [Syntrophorhabdaceae bacterium]